MLSLRWLKTFREPQIRRNDSLYNLLLYTGFDLKNIFNLILLITIRGFNNLKYNFTAASSEQIVHEKNLKEIHGLTTVHRIRRICCNRIYYYTGRWVEKEYKGSSKKFKGKQLAGKCTEPERNNKEKGSVWKMERIVIS